MPPTSPRPEPAPAPFIPEHTGATPGRMTGGECAKAYLVTGGNVIMQEYRDDGSPGICLVVPPDEWSEEWLAWFNRFCAKKQGKQRLRLVP